MIILKTILLFIQSIVFDYLILRGYNEKRKIEARSAGRVTSSSV